ncbi:MAG: iron-containing alcohol dehydrogenase [Bacteroidales bacterium]|jgi:alcohol dehydrogenase YqhD (iron-dependent ADH family)|nr:iron-containing alcohol dehydrogenase [Bacteroidales bacterium]
MKDFTFYNPTRIEFGKEKENNIGNYISDFGLQKVLIVYGSERIKKEGLFNRVTASLENNNIQWLEIGGVVSNPLLSKVNEAILLAKAEKADAVLAVGGGSVLDTCKAVAAGAVYGGNVWDFFINKANAEAALPVFSVLTLAATGSEMNAGGVVMNDETKEKLAIMSPHLYPKVSVINPDLMATVGKDYLAYSAADIFAHCLDLYFTASYIPESTQVLIENILRTVITTTDSLLIDSDNYNARAEFAWASTMALNGNTFVGVEGHSFDTHMIEHALSALFNVPHGAGLSAVFPAWMRWHNNQRPERYERFAKNVFNTEGIENGIQKLEEWYKKIGTPICLAEANIPKTAIRDLAENAFVLAKTWGMDKNYSVDTIAEILEKA